MSTKLEKILESLQKELKRKIDRLRMKVEKIEQRINSTKLRLYDMGQAKHAMLKEINLECSRLQDINLQLATQTESLKKVTEETLIEELGWPMQIINALHNNRWAQIKTIGDLTQLKKDGLKHIQAIGELRMAMIVKKLAEHGFALKN